jgi:hypothetical protein
MTHPSATRASGTPSTGGSSEQQQVRRIEDLSSARSIEFDRGHSVPSLSDSLRFSALASILRTTKPPLDTLPIPDPLPRSGTAGAPAPTTSSWNQTINMLVTQSSAISLSPPPSPPFYAAKQPLSSSGATTKRTVRFQQQKDSGGTGGIAVSTSTCNPSCTQSSCFGSAVHTPRRRYQRRNSKTPAMLMRSMSTSQAGQAFHVVPSIPRRIVSDDLSISVEQEKTDGCKRRKLV